MVSESAMFAASDRFSTAFDHAVIGMALIDVDGTFIRVNPALCRLIGRTETELLSMRWQDVTHPDDVEPGSALVEDALAGSGRQFRLEKRYLRADGGVLWVDLSVALVTDESAEPLFYFTQVVDVSERRQHIDDLTHQAFHDPLTGLANRALFVDHLQQALLRSQRSATMPTLFFIDIDDLKGVNDRLGHGAGDELLVEVSRRLRSVLRAADTVGRLGGDEFLVLCEGLPSTDDAMAVAARLSAAVARPVVVQKETVGVTSSIGVARARHGEQEPGDLLQEADLAMYEAKRTRTGCQLAR